MMNKAIRLKGIGASQPVRRAVSRGGLEVSPKPEPATLLRQNQHLETTEPLPSKKGDEPH